MALDIKIKYFRDDVVRLEKIDKGDWIDVYASIRNEDEEIFIPEGETMLIPLGFAMKLPKGYEAHLVPRSSTFKKWGFIQTNSMGVIDESYCGSKDEWMMPVYCLKGRDITLRQTKMGDIHEAGTWLYNGDKIAQFRIMKKMEEVNFIESTLKNETDRGGFGSTGSR